MRGLFLSNFNFMSIKVVKYMTSPEASGDSRDKVDSKQPDKNSAGSFTKSSVFDSPSVFECQPGPYGISPLAAAPDESDTHAVALVSAARVFVTKEEDRRGARPAFESAPRTYTHTCAYSKCGREFTATGAGARTQKYCCPQHRYLAQQEEKQKQNADRHKSRSFGGYSPRYGETPLGGNGPYDENNGPYDENNGPFDGTKGPYGN
jgi:hypothetical protein